MATVIVEILKIVPITIVGIITVYIAWRQWQTSRQRLQLDMYDGSASSAAGC